MKNRKLKQKLLKISQEFFKSLNGEITRYKLVRSIRLGFDKNYDLSYNAGEKVI